MSVGSEKRSARLFDQISPLLAVTERLDAAAYRQLTDALAAFSPRRVLEIGPGRGALARRIIRRLQDLEFYLALDVSRANAVAAQRGIGALGPAATILTDGAPVLPVRSGAVDAVVSAYVFDGFGKARLRPALAGARDALRPDGVLAVLSTARGRGPWSRAVMRLWDALYRVHPAIVGESAVNELAPRLDPAEWRIEVLAHMAFAGFASELVIARKLA